MIDLPLKPLEIARIAVLIFFAILFIQSGLDKILDHEGNKSYVRSVFAKTPLADFSGALFIMLTILECSAGILSVAGIGFIFAGDYRVARLALLVCTVCILSLFMGQRIAHDYPGAADLAPYFIAAVFGLYLFSV